MDAATAGSRNMAQFERFLGVGVALDVCLRRRLAYLVVHGQSIGQVDHFRRDGAEDEGG